MSTFQLIFVYNAGNGLFGMVSDWAHKILSPSTYSCHLCTLTHGNFMVKQRWKNFIRHLPVKTTFLYKDEFEKQFGIAGNYPAIYYKHGENLRPFLTARQIEQCSTLEALESLVSAELTKHDQYHHPNL